MLPLSAMLDVLFVLFFSLHDSITFRGFSDYILESWIAVCVAMNLNSLCVDFYFPLMSVL